MFSLPPYILSAWSQDWISVKENCVLSIVCTNKVLREKFIRILQIQSLLVVNVDSNCKFSISCKSVLCNSVVLKSGYFVRSLDLGLHWECLIHHHVNSLEICFIDQFSSLKQLNEPQFLIKITRNIDFYDEVNSSTSKFFAQVLNSEVYSTCVLGDNSFCGYGTLLVRDKFIYLGQFMNDFIHGHGSLKYASGDYFEGKFEFNQRHGEGVMKYANGDQYSGSWERGIKQGIGKVCYQDGDIYNGTWLNNIRSGCGELIMNNGNTYNGDFIGDNMSGTGTILYVNKDTYTGDWYKNNQHGIGVMKYANGDEYSGHWVGNYRHGIGSYKYNTTSVFTGEWQFGNRHGSGEVKYVNGDVCGGFWEYDLKMKDKCIFVRNIHHITGRS